MSIALIQRRNELAAEYDYLTTLYTVIAEEHGQPLGTFPALERMTWVRMTWVRQTLNDGAPFVEGSKRWKITPGTIPLDAADNIVPPTHPRDQNGALIDPLPGNRINVNWYFKALETIDAFVLSITDRCANRGFPDIIPHYRAMVKALEWLIYFIDILKHEMEAALSGNSARLLAQEYMEDGMFVGSSEYRLAAQAAMEAKITETSSPRWRLPDFEDEESEEAQPSGLI